MRDVSHFEIIHRFFQRALVADIADHDIDFILDIFHQDKISAIIHEHRTQAVAHHQARRHGAIDAHAAGNQWFHCHTPWRSAKFYYQRALEGKAPLIHLCNSR